MMPPTSADAARQLLEQPVDAAYRDAWARELARPLASAVAVDAAAMAFRVGREWLAVPLALAASVAPRAPLHRLPHRDGGALLGVVGVDGRLLPAVSLARLLAIEDHDAAAPAGRHAFARLLVLADPDSARAQRFALPVDEVHGVLRYARAALQPPAATVGHAPPPYIEGVVRADAIEAGLLDATRLMAQLQGLLR